MTDADVSRFSIPPQPEAVHQLSTFVSKMSEEQEKRCVGSSNLSALLLRTIFQSIRPSDCSLRWFEHCFEASR